MGLDLLVQKYLRYWYNGTCYTSTYGRREKVGWASGTQFTCFTSAKVLALRVQILTLRVRDRLGVWYSIYLLYWYKVLALLAKSTDTDAERER